MKNKETGAEILTIFCFGETVWENHNGKMLLGGPQLSLAARLAGLGNKAIFYSRTGSDKPGDMAIEKITGHSIDASFIQKDTRHPTSRATVTDSGYCLEPGAHEYITVRPDTLEKISRIPLDVLCFDTLIQTFSESSSALSLLLDRIQAKEVLYDFNLRGRYYGKKHFEASLKLSTIVRCNDEESQTISTILFGQAFKPADFALAISRTYFVPVVCVRLKNGGAVICHAGSTEIITAPAGHEPCSSGTGPIFNAAFLTAFLSGKSPGDSVKAAMTAAFAERKRLTS
jgi:sugar/nucleoside kinase (ribokinase family)